MINIPLSTLLCIVFVGYTKGQNWGGVFRLSGNCASSLCCCRTGVMTVSKTSSSISISSTLVSCPTTSDSLSFSNVYGYSVSYSPIVNQTVTFTLSYDYQSITLTNNRNSYCNDIAFRTQSYSVINSSTILSSSNVFLLFFVIWILKNSLNLTFDMYFIISFCTLPFFSSEK